MGELFLENPEFVAEEVPDEAGGGAADGSEVSPYLARERYKIDGWRDIGHHQRRGRHIDNHPDNANRQKLRELPALLGFLLVPESPALVEKIAESDGNEKRHGFESGIICPRTFSAHDHFDIQDGQVDEKVHKPDHHEFRELGDDRVSLAEICDALIVLHTCLF